MRKGTSLSKSVRLALTSAAAVTVLAFAAPTFASQSNMGTEQATNQQAASGAMQSEQKLEKWQEEAQNLSPIEKAFFWQWNTPGDKTAANRMAAKDSEPLTHWG